MIVVSNAFKKAMTNPVKELRAYLEIDTDERITDADDLISLKISAEGGLCKTVMRKCEAKFLGEHYLLGSMVNFGLGVKIADGSFEYIDYGSFLITETTTSKDTGVTTIIGYDSMIRSYIKYSPYHTYPITVGGFASEICQACGIVLGNSDFVNSDLIIDSDLYANINGITYRDVLLQIAEVSGTVAMISNDNKLYFKSLYDTKEQLTYDNLFKLKQEPLYGEINSVVLSRSPQEDNVVLRDDASIEINGLTEFKIVNNEIVDKRREDVITSIYNTLHGINYYPFEADTEGLGWYEIGDQINVLNDAGVVFNTTIFNITLDMNGSLKEKLFTKAQNKTETNYQRAGGITNRIKNTEIQVDKQNQTITSLVSDMYDEDGLINENFTQIYQDITNVVTAVQNSGGANLLKNSVMFGYDSNKIPNDWTLSSTGTLDIQASSEASASGGISGNIFTLNNKTVKQRVIVKQDTADIPTDQKSYYTFSCKVKKNSTGTGYIKISNANEEYIINLNNGEAPFYGDYEIKGLLPKLNYYEVELYGSTGSNMTFTDCMFALGEYKTQWQQANGEIMNTQVNVNQNGILVRSSVYLGDYTVMSPLEFAGYSMINGTLTKVFTLNKDTTEMRKIKAIDEVTMPPIKIVPITTGAVLGWAFVPST